MDIAPFIKRVARGKHGAEHLSRAEAESVFSSLLAPDAEPLQLGAFLIAQRMKGESSAELAGFIEAARARIAGYGALNAPAGAVDLPCYAGKRRAAHAHLAAAIEARDHGTPLFIHGVDHIDGRVTAWQVLQQTSVRRASSLSEAMTILQGEHIVYADLADLCPDLYRIYMLRPKLGVRSFSNTVARLLNPARCDGQLNGFFHTPYAEYMATANRLLGQPRSLIFMGAEGEPELYADRQKVILKQQDDSVRRVSYPPAGVGAYPRSAADLSMLQDDFAAMLAGRVDRRQRAVIARMREAFNWAGSGEFSATWIEETIS